MCGIVGAVAERNITAILLEGLKRLEYRGYDSTGVAIDSADSKSIVMVKRTGKVKVLEDAIQERKQTKHYKKEFQVDLYRISHRLQWGGLQ